MNGALPQDALPLLHEGSRSFGNLLVTWRGEPSPLGWTVRCHLTLGPDSATLALDTGAPRAPFTLYDNQETAWGHLLLRRDESGRQLALAIDYHLGPASEQQMTLCSWHACNPCGQTPPFTGEKTVGGVRAAWTVAGSDEACLAVRLKISLADGTEIASTTLTPLAPEWRRTIQREEGHTEAAFVLELGDDGTARLEAVFLHADLPGERAELDRFPAPPVPPGPRPDGPPGDGVVLGPPMEFASFAYPRSLQPPTPAQWARRFVEIDNTTEFQNTLRSLYGQKDWPGMVAEAQDFTAPASKKYPGQYVRRIADLTGPMGRLEGPPVRAFLALRPASLEELKAALTGLLGMPVEDFLALPAYPGQLGQLQDSLIALLVPAESSGPQENALIQALIVCHTAELVAHTPDLLATPEDLREPLAASPLLPATLFPLAPPTAAPAGTSYVKPLGFADIQVIKQRLLRYRLGEIAHVENVMRGETKERNQRHSRRIESRERDGTQQTDANDREQDYQGHSQADSGTVDNPLGTLKREFDKLQEQYGSDGLSVTMSGSWTDTLGGPAQLNQSASDYARRLLDRAAAQVALRTESERLRRSVEEFVEQNLNRFDNAAGDSHVVGVYRWIDEIHAVHLEHRGSRLVLEFVIPSPAADYVRRNNLLHGINASAPIPPWQGDKTIAPILSAADISRNNYAALAARYNATTVEPPPPASRSVSVSLQNDPPRPLAQLEIPHGYQATSGSVSYGWSGTTPPPLDVLVGAVGVKIDPAQNPSPGTLPIAPPQPDHGTVPVAVLSAGTGYAVNVTLACACSDGSPLFQHWQMATYQAVMAAYQGRKEDYFRAMGRFAASGGPEEADGRRDTERAALQQAATECLIAPFLAWDTAAPAWRQDVVNFSLIPFFRRALDWGEMTYTFYGSFFADDDPQRPPWLTMAQARKNSPGFSEFLEAGAARLLVPVQPGLALPLLFYLASQGRFWQGAAELAPVYEADWFLANELKSLLHTPLPGRPGERWEMEVATSLFMLQQDASLPDYPREGSDEGEEP